MKYRKYIYQDDYADRLASNDLYADYDKERLLIGAYFQRNYLPFFPQDRGVNILDVGCGRGLFIDACAQYGYKNAKGVDLSPSNVKFCAEHGYACIEMDALDYLQQNPGSVDVILFNDMIEHLTRDEIFEMLFAMHGALRDGGVLIVKTINAANPYMNGSGRYIDFSHEISFVDASLLQVLRAAGFSAVQVKGTDIYVRKNLINWLAKGISWLLCKYFYLMNWLFGRKSVKVFEKDLIACAYRRDG